ncbi:hypothetical protein DYB36_008234 [Aphanomyces astaci]|uniref:D-isomer specific 2-hydroxyacid dehydrogenase NAD-binding domain-containing protein n=1 Tax=Aphanomyces astaci TaxID=112090 RepID=A0A397AMQ0_APHAT|nr:hypothetical protein DYB36_008234 [Aphanomyces astaci]
MDDDQGLLPLDPNHKLTTTAAATDDSSEDVNLDAAYDEIEYMDLKVPGKEGCPRAEKKGQSTADKRGGPKQHSSLTSEMKTSRAVARVTQRLGLERVHEIQLEYASLKSKFGELDYDKANAMIRNLMAMGLSQIEIRGILGIGGYRLQRLYSAQAAKPSPTYAATDELVLPSPAPLTPSTLHSVDKSVHIPVLSSIPHLVNALTKKLSAFPLVASRISFVAVDAAELSVDASSSALVEAAEIILGDAAACVLALPHTRHLKWLQLTSATVDIDLVAQPKRDFACTRAGGIHGPHVAQRIIAIERSFHKATQLQATRAFDPHELTYRSAKDVSVAILGYGDIGAHVAKLVAAAGFRVMALKRRTARVSWMKVDGVGGFDVTDRLDHVLANADYIVNALPCTPHTHRLLAGSVLHLCAHKSPCLIDLSPWHVVDEATVVAAMEHKWLSSAVLDVPEPVPPTSPLWDHPQVTLTPRVAPPHQADAVADVFMQNLWHFIGHAPLQYAVEWTQGY